MATKGFSAPAKSPAEQDAIRRQAKAKKRTHSKKGPQAPAETFTDGLVADRLNQRGLAMLDRLELSMVSTAPSIDDALKRATLIYVSNFADAKWCGAKTPWQRHQAAVAAACTGLSGSLRAHAEWSLKQAFNATR